MLKLFGSEAQAYLKLGLMSPAKRRVRQSPRGQARLGVLFVPGVGANGSQFLGLKQELEPYADWFGAFEYFSLRHPTRVAIALEAHIRQVAEQTEDLVVIGHSLGGLLLRMVLQSEAPPPPNIRGYVSICAPLHGTWRSKLALSPGLRALAPDSTLMSDVLSQAHRLEQRLDGRILAIGARVDQMIHPANSAFLEGQERLEITEAAHAGSLFDPMVFEAVASAVDRWTRRAPDELRRPESE